MNFDVLFLNLKIPVVVCEADDLKVSYINTEAKALLYVKIDNKYDNLYDIFSPKSKTEFDFIIQALENQGFVSDFILTVKSMDSEENLTYNKIKVTANMIGSDKKYFCFYLSGVCELDAPEKERLDGLLIKILSIAHQSMDIDKAIDSILYLLGESLNVSRVYVFENTCGKYTSNTYEWCAQGIEPAIDGLQHIPLADFCHEDFVSSTGIVICNDIRDMDDVEKKFLELQGIKSLLTVPLFEAGQPIGFMGCDECTSYRKWNAFEIKLLLNVSAIISSLVIRKKTQASAETAFQIMKRVIDNIDAMVYVVNIDNNRVIYMNSAMARERGIKDLEHEELYCYQMFMRDMDGPCEYCLNRQLFDEEGKPVGTLRGEFQSTINNKWYTMASSAVEWINGEYVYLQSAVEITERKNNEDILKKSASMDSMTNVFNREWGYKSLDKLISDARDSECPSSVIFIDIDGLKYINDNYGHIEGDKIIIGIVNVLKKCTRKNDVIFRWGGDEFIVLLPGCKKENAESIMKNSDALLSEINKNSNKPYAYAFSYGIFEINNYESYTADSVIRMADTLMYEQKNKKKDNNVR